MDEVLLVFVQEAREQLSGMESGLLGMEAGDHDPETVNAIFRAAHTIKGGAGVVELPRIESFTHALENVLDRVRNGELVLGGELISRLLEGCDHLSALLDVVEGASVDENALKANGESIIAAIQQLSGMESAQPDAEKAVSADAPASSGEGGGDLVINDCWHISLRFAPHVLKCGMDPLAFLRYLLSLGEIAHLTTLCDAMPVAAEMDPESCYLGFEINFRSRATKEQIEAVFAFVRDDCSLYILPPHSRIGDYVKLIEGLPEQTMHLGEILVASGALTADELSAGLQRQAEAQAPMQRPPLGEILVEQHAVQAELVDAAVAKQKQVGEKKAAEARTIRVHADKLDDLIDLVGELVIAGASANLLAKKSGQTSLVEATSVLSRLVENIRDSALQLRMVQIGETFNRFHRVVRDVSREMEKEIELVIRGAETELDKSVVERIGDPLMHLVRNAIDHGIEPAEVREARGKALRGRLELNAFHDSGSIVIEVSDDGGGLNKEKIRKKAIDRGLIAATDNLTDKELFNLIFEPGFSTADKVTNISGRGVGMDVVRKNITALRGSVEVNSQEGEGSRFKIRLPLTLAIIDGFLTSVGDACYVIPLDMVVECIELKGISGDRDYLSLRGEVLPFVRLRELFELPGERPVRENVVVVHFVGQKVGIVVDQLLGEFQTVIKPLGTIFRNVRGIAGSTILGSGEVALILDVQALIQRNKRDEERELGYPQQAARSLPQ
ncbi:MAG: chemotaxis protein CheA [Zoogloea sp.]|nr:chemotaxis protein CheA [Zoogloea sp.]